jgi:hypothetical protein
MFMDGLLVATGFFGALTVTWLVGRAVAYFDAGPKVSVCFGPEVNEALAHAIGKARREVLLLGDVDPALAGPLAEAQNRTVALDVLLSSDADPTPFEKLNVHARSASKAPPAGLLAIVDDRVVIVAAADGQAVIATGHAELVGACRQQFAAHHPVSKPAAEPAPAPAPAPALTPPPKATVLMPPKSSPAPQPNYQAPAAAPPKPAPAPQPNYQAPSAPPPPATSPVDELLAAVARGASTQANDEEDEEEDESAAPVARATADLFARLRKEVGSAGRDDSSDKAE